MKSISLLLLLTAQYISALTIGTYNIGLEERASRERNPYIIDHLNSSGVDILCIDELWLGPSNMRHYIEQLKDTYPYTASLLPETIIKSIPCDILTNPPDECVDSFTSDLSSGSHTAFISCMREYLHEQLTDQILSPCWACLIEQGYAYYSKEKNLPRALTHCYTHSEEWVQNLGLLALSKYPIVEQSTHVYTSFLAPRGYIDTTIRLPEQDIQFICTHLAPRNDDIPYIYGITSPYNSWAEENFGQTMELVQHMILSYNESRAQFVAGDLNHSPSTIPKISPSFALSFNYMLRYSNAMWVSTEECTSCTDNTVLDIKSNTIYDYIWMRSNYSINITTVRFWDKQLCIAGSDVSHLSDHYGTVIIINETSDDILFTSQNINETLYYPRGYGSCNFDNKSPFDHFMLFIILALLGAAATLYISHLAKTSSINL